MSERFAVLTIAAMLAVWVCASLLLPIGRGSF
jgi:hypothetical protein